MRRREDQAEVVSGQLVSDEPGSIAIAAHELKTPLAVIRQLSLELASYPADAASVEQIARQIELTAERSLRLTRDITQTSRLQPELFPLEPLNTRQIIHSVADELMPLYAAHDLQIILRMPRRLPNIISHSDLLRRVLLNFGDNALYYADKAGKVVIEGKMIHRQDIVRLGVTDGGPSLVTSRVKRARLQTEYGRPAGSNLGLLIAETFAETIQAKIGTIRRRNGTQYYIDVPISKQLSLI